MKVRSRLLMVFRRNFSEKRQIWVSEPHFGEIKRWRTTLVNGSLESPWSTFYSRYFNFFRYLLRFRYYEAKCVQLACFHRGRPLCT